MISQKLIYCMGHGVGQVESTEEKEVGGQLLKFINAKILSNGLKVSFPDNSKVSKHRKLITKKDLNRLYSFLEEKDYTPDNSTWNRRNRDYLNRIKSLDVLEVASILRDLLVLEKSKKLSFGERKMKDQVLSLLADEIHLITKEPIKIIKNNLTQ